MKPFIYLPLCGLDGKYSQHTKYADDNPHYAKQAQIFQPILQIPEVSKETEEGKEEQLPRIMNCECHKTQESEEAQKSVDPPRSICIHIVIMHYILLVGKPYYDFIIQWWESWDAAIVQAKRIRKLKNC